MMKRLVYVVRKLTLNDVELYERDNFVNVHVVIYLWCFRAKHRSKYYVVYSVTPVVKIEAVFV